MNEIVQLVMQKTGLSQDRAQEVVNLVVSHLKGKVPGELSSHLDSFLSRGSTQTGASSASSATQSAKSAAAGLGGSNPQKNR